jgi:hypothetical protein
MITLRRVLVGGGFALLLAGSAWAGDNDTKPEAAPAPTGAPAAASKLDPAAQAKAAEHDRLMRETVCRSLDAEDTGSHVHHRTCMTRTEWLAYDKRHSSTYDPDHGAATVKE